MVGRARARKRAADNRHLYDIAVLATLCDRLRSGDVWVERSANTAALKASCCRSPKFPRSRPTGISGDGRRVAGQVWRGRLHVAPVKAATPPEADAQAARIVAMPLPTRMTEIMHGADCATGFAAAFSNLRTGERCDNENALLAAILADATNLGLTRPALRQFLRIGNTGQQNVIEHCVR